MTDTYLNPFKAHLYRLPNVNKPIPSYPGESKDGVVIFPMFLTDPKDTSIEHHIVRSACWARRSWILFSDAISLDIGFKFYVEMKVRERVIPILKENDIDVKKDVLYFDGSLFEQNEPVHLGKKLAFVYDDQFSDYTWVWQMDSDNFLASPSREKFPFFEKELNSPLELRVAETNQLFPYQSIEDLHWWWRIIKTESPTTKKDEKILEWIRRAKLVADGDIVDKYSQKGGVRIAVAGVIYAIPSKEFLRKPKRGL